MVAEDRLHGMSTRLDDDEVEAERQPRRLPAGRLDPAEGSPMQPRLLPPVHRLLGQAEVPTATPADLDDDQLPRWSRIDGNDVELRPADMDLAPEEGPASRHERRGDPVLGPVAGDLELRPHAPIVAANA